MIIRVPIELPLGLNQGADAAIGKLKGLEQQAKLTKSQMDALHEEATRLNAGWIPGADKAGKFADSVGRVSTTLARSADAFGLPAGPLRTLDDLMDVAELGFGNLARSAAGFNAASAGIAGAGLAIGTAIGSWLNTFPAVQKAADSLFHSLFRFVGLAPEITASAGPIADFSKKMAAANVDAMRKQAAQLRAGGMGNKDLAEFFGVKEGTAGKTDFGRLTPELAKELGLTKELLKADEQRVTAAKKQKEELRQLIEMMSGPKFNPAGALKVDFAKDLMGGGMATSLALSESRTSVSAKGADVLGGLMGGGIATKLSLSWSRERELDRIGKARQQSEQAAAAAMKWETALQGVAMMAGTLGGNLGNALQVVGNIGQAFQKLSSLSRDGKTGWAAATDEEKFGAVAGAVGQIGGLVGGKAGGAISGAASGAQMGMALGPIGAGVGAVVGGIAGWFGAGKKQREELKQMKEQFTESFGGMDELKARAMEANVSLDKLFAAKDKKGLEAAIKSVTEGLEKFEHKMQSLKEARGAAESIMDRLAGGEWSDALRASLGTMVGKVQEALLASGLGFMATGPLRESKEFGAAQGMASDAAQLLAAMREAGVVDAGLMGAAGQSAEELRQQAVAAAEAAGVGPAEATKAGFGAIAPLLREQLNASLASGVDLDANTKALIDEAKKNGISIVADPLVQQLAVQKDMLGELRALNNKGGGGEADQEFATGTRGLRLVKRDMLARIHEGEGLLVVPRHEMGKGRLVFESFAKGTDRDRPDRDDRPGPLPDGGGGGGGDGTAGGGGSPTTSDVAAMVQAAVARARTIQVSVTSAPQVTIVDESMVKTLEGQRAFNRLLADELHQVLRQGDAALESDIARVVRRELRSA